MSDGSEWSRVARAWAPLWGAFADPARHEIIRAAAIGPGTRVLDVGCGSGEFLALLETHGATAVGADPAPLMVELARASGAEVVIADVELLPFAAASFDVATAVNALQFADDTTAALRELARVVRPGGAVAIANWAEGSRNDIGAVEAAIAHARDEEPSSDGPLQRAGGIDAAFAAADLHAVDSGVVEVTWEAADDATLVRGILLGEDAATMADLHAVVTRVAAPFRRGDGRYVLRNWFRWSLARR